MGEFMLTCICFEDSSMKLFNNSLRLLMRGKLYLLYVIKLFMLYAANNTIVFSNSEHENDDCCLKYSTWKLCISEPLILFYVYSPSIARRVICFLGLKPFGVKELYYVKIHGRKS